MPFIEWEMQGMEFANCNCNWGCPCQFNGLPTHGHCRAHSFVQVDRGRFGSISLDGLRWGIMAMWPGPIHLGDGTLRVIVDERADERQRAALETIAQGGETDAGVLIFQVFAAVISTRLPTLFRRIDLDIDIGQRTARVRVPDVLESSAEPIRNPVTGAPHYARVTLPAGFEFTEAEFASGKASASGPIELDFNDTHAHLARIHWTTHGVVRPG
jgi:hypothetical protein